MAQRNIKARYHTRYLGEQDVSYRKCSMVKGEGSETPNLEIEDVTEKLPCWLVSFPQGHSIRVTSKKELERMGYHLRPRMVDMETGDVVNIGGDPYDFANNDQPNQEVIVMDDEEIPMRKAKASSN